MIKVCVTGACGRMGTMIIESVLRNSKTKLSAIVERKGHSGINKEFYGLKLTDNLKEAMKTSDVLIDFTSPESTLANAKDCAAQKKKIIIGTTGLSPQQEKKIKEYAKKTAVVFAPNMSAGINLLLNLVKQAAGALKGYDIEIVEYHHSKKKDAPSGTAKALAQAAANGAKINLKENMVCGRAGMIGERTKKEIGVMAVRAGDIVGEHTVMFASEGERVEITHKASSRSTFSEGAVKAAVFLASKKTGFYDMQNVLGIKK